MSLLDYFAPKPDVSRAQPAQTLDDLSSDSSNDEKSGDSDQSESDSDSECEEESAPKKSRKSYTNEYKCEVAEWLEERPDLTCADAADDFGIPHRVVQGTHFRTFFYPLYIVGKHGILGKSFVSAERSHNGSIEWKHTCAVSQKTLLIVVK